MSKIIYLSFVFVTIFCSVSSGSNFPDDYDDYDDPHPSSLLAVAVLFRHGDRTPLSETWPSDKYYQDSSLYPEGVGQLNNQGKKRHYELGKWFRQRYSEFLPSAYNPSDIYVKSTDVDRALMSAACNLAGLYPPLDSQVWNSELLWQPIPIHTTEAEEDPILAASEPCAKYDSLFETYQSLPFIDILNEEHAELYKNLSVLMEYNVTNYTVGEWVHSQVMIYKSYGLDYPSWVDDHWDEITDLAAFRFQLYTLETDLARLRSGPFFNYLFNYFDEVVANTTTTKFLMLSAHDTTIVNTLNSMMAFDNAPPEFASSVIWELRKYDGDGGEVFVNAYFRNSTHMEQLSQFECMLDCYLEDLKHLGSYIAVDLDTWRSECAEEN